MFHLSSQPRSIWQWCHFWLLLVVLRISGPYKVVQQRTVERHWKCLQITYKADAFKKYYNSGETTSCFFSPPRLQVFILLHILPMTGLVLLINIPTFDQLNFIFLNMNPSQREDWDCLDKKLKPGISDSGQTRMYHFGRWACRGRRKPLGGAEIKNLKCDLLGRAVQ